MNKNRLARLCTALGASLLVSATALAPTTFAACSGTGCNGVDPGAGGCTVDATTVRRQTVRYYSSQNFRADVTIELRWSPSCKTNWARASVGYSNPPRWGYQMGVTLRDAYNNRIYPSSFGPVANTRYAYGDMWYAPTQPVKACVEVDDFRQPETCTTTA